MSRTREPSRSLAASREHVTAAIPIVINCRGERDDCTEQPIPRAILSFDPRIHRGRYVTRGTPFPRAFDHRFVSATLRLSTRRKRAKVASELSVIIREASIAWSALSPHLPILHDLTTSLTEWRVKMTEVQLSQVWSINLSLHNSNTKKITFFLILLNLEGVPSFHWL